MPPRVMRTQATREIRVSPAGEKTAPVITLEYGAPVPGRKGDELLAGKFDWHEDLAGHREYFVFLDKMAEHFAPVQSIQGPAANFDPEVLARHRL